MTGGINPMHSGKYAIYLETIKKKNPSPKITTAYANGIKKLLEQSASFDVKKNDRRAAIKQHSGRDSPL
jgi:hypothetical protein